MTREKLHQFHVLLFQLENGHSNDIHVFAVRTGLSVLIFKAMAWHMLNTKGAFIKYKNSSIQIADFNRISTLLCIMYTCLYLHFLGILIYFVYFSHMFNTSLGGSIQYPQMTGIK